MLQSIGGAMRYYMGVRQGKCWEEGSENGDTSGQDGSYSSWNSGMCEGFCIKNPFIECLL